MRGFAGGEWTREDVERLVADHEGYLVWGAEPDSYVKPTNWGDLLQTLQSRRAIMIVGQSGSGKTATSAALWKAMKQASPALSLRSITHGPDQLDADRTLPPVLTISRIPGGDTASNRIAGPGTTSLRQPSKPHATIGYENSTPA
ncbi:hypothetical protein [Sphingopyxis fribergensis]